MKLIKNGVEFPASLEMLELEVGNQISDGTNSVTCGSGKVAIVSNSPATVNGNAILTAVPDGAVTTAKLADGAVTAAKIESGITDTIDTLKLEVANLNAIVHDTVAKTVEEEYDDVNSISTPSSVTVEGTAYPVIDNTRMLLAGVKGKTIKCKQLLNIPNVVETTTNGVTYSIVNGVITLNGTAATAIYINCYDSLTLSGNYYIKSFGIVNGVTIYYQETNEDYSPNHLTNYSSNGKATTFSSFSRLLIVINEGVTFSNTKLKPMLVSGTTAPTDFQAYFTDLKNPVITGLTSKDSSQSELGAIAFASQSLNAVDTIYDELVVIKNSSDDYYTMKKITRLGSADLGTLTWAYESQYLRFKATITDLKIAYGRTVKMICPIYETKSNGEAFYIDWNMVIYNGFNTNEVNCQNHSYTDGAALKTAMNGIMLVYEIETPIETTISSTLTYEDVTILTEQGGAIAVTGNDNLIYCAKPQLVLDMNIKYWQEV